MYSARRRVRAVVIDDYEHGQSATAGEIIEGDGAIDTGLLDADGNCIYRVREPIRLGFECATQHKIGDLSHTSHYGK